MRRLAALLGLLLVAAAPSAGPPPPSPAQLFGPLYRAVELRRVFPDSKTFADAVPRRSPAAILAAFESCRCGTPAALRAFVLAHFTLPAEPMVPAQARLPLADHIDALWPVLTRPPAPAPPGSSALALPRRFVVPGGRFREVYYWDSWFTMLGLRASGRQDLVEDMVANFGSLLDRYGHIPNGTRTYYLSRSQPPFFYLMAAMARDPATRAARLRWLRIEHAFWMRGGRAVRLPGGGVLNRYWDNSDTPRDESYREDVALADATPSRDRRQLFRDLRAAAESGWDFSSRWLGDGRTLATIRTTRLVPVDLNSLLYGLERAIADGCAEARDSACQADFTRRAATRSRAMQALWNPRGFFADYDLDRDAPADAPTAAMAFPLFVGLATPDQARATAASLAPLIGEGGLTPTLRVTGQQWDAPNGWAPLQWIAIQGLRRYGEDATATRIKAGWLATVARTYAETGKLLEKYDVRTRRPGGGGEYPNQDGFGWTNGVTRALLAEAPAR